MITAIPTFSEQLQTYLESIKSKTGRAIQIDLVNTVSLPGMNFAFTPDPTFIRVKVVLPFQGTVAQFEQSFAHEATHGLLLYGLGYSTLTTYQKLNPTESFSRNLIATMIDDVVVNDLLQKKAASSLSEKIIKEWSTGKPKLLKTRIKISRRGLRGRCSKLSLSIMQKF